ncbi:hypothetical protein HDV00_007444 [Rhizophlyctis rosea]|nr:hypothetical protein HDV00_007444 [Rhizophlyctis rosea]
MPTVAKWRSRAQAAPEAFHYVLAELQHDAANDPNRFGIHGVRVGDGLIPSKLVAKLREQVAVLENVPDKVKDWHPGSNDQVHDLVHPSLFCYVEGVTSSFAWEEAKHLYWQQFVGGGKIGGSASIASHYEEDSMASHYEKHWVVHKWEKVVGKFWGHWEKWETQREDVADGEKSVQKPLGKRRRTQERFQWLPAEFSVRDGGTVGITSYINNLHPRTHKPLYQTIATIFEHFVPLFEGVLTDLFHPRPPAITVDPYDWYGHCPQPGVLSEDEYVDWLDARTPTQPDIPVFSPLPDCPVVSLQGRNLQVIVKLANIHLTPEKPDYPGGGWHVEGMKNEHVVASGVCYYSTVNITQPKLSFRAAVSQPEFEEDDEGGVYSIYGLRDGVYLEQDLGWAAVHEGRCIAYPNLYQHRFEPFSLADRTRPGHLKSSSSSSSTQASASFPPRWFRPSNQGGFFRKLLIP